MRFSSRRMPPSLAQHVTHARVAWHRLTKSPQYAVHRRYALYIALVVVPLLLIRVYYANVVLSHGVFFPPFVNWRTSAYDAHVAAVPLLPSDDWRPGFRVVVSLTTMPHHMMHLSETLDSLAAQSLKADAIYLNVPQGVARTGEAYEIPHYLRRYMDGTGDDAVPLTVLHPARDYGPLTKLYPTLGEEADPTTLIVTVDDDAVYDATLLKTLAWYAAQRPEAAWGACGWGFQPVWDAATQVVPVYVPYLMRGDGGRRVEVLQAVCGNAYRRGFFGNLMTLGSPPDDCFTTDDLWISGNLEFGQGHSQPVPRVLLKGDDARRLAAQPASWKAQDTRAWSLHGFNEDNHQDIRCIRAVERTFQQPWFQRPP